MEELGIIRDIHVGLRDVDRPCLWFTIHAFGGSTLRVFFGQDLLDFIAESKVYKLEDLEGKACVIERKDGLMNFIRLFEW